MTTPLKKVIGEGGSYPVFNGLTKMSIVSLTRFLAADE